MKYLTCRCTDFVRLFLDLERPEVNERNEWNYELCGNDTLSSLPQRRFYSSTPYLILEFHTDHVQTNNTGFRGVFNFIDRGRSYIRYTLCLKNTGTTIYILKTTPFFALMAYIFHNIDCDLYCIKFASFNEIHLSVYEIQTFKY